MNEIDYVILSCLSTLFNYENQIQFQYYYFCLKLLDVILE